MAYSQAWLEDSASIKGIFAEVEVYDIVAASTVTKYISTLGYVTTDASISYLPIITGGVQITESLPLDGQAQLSFGDIELNNVTMELDEWIDPTKYIWSNKRIQVYLGDPRWECANLAAIHSTFKLIFDGVVNDIDSRDPTSLNLKIRDKLERLNTPITESKLGIYGTWANGQSNKETIRPIVFGEVHNIQPLLIDPSTQEYLVSDGSRTLNVTATSATGNLITCDSTSILSLNTPIVFNQVTIDNITSSLGNIVFGAVYYVKTIASGTTFTISTSSGGSTFTLANATGNLIGTVESYATERIIELRDNGNPSIALSTDLTKGKIRLSSGAQVGTLTASVQGVKNSINLSTGALVVGTYVNNIANLIALIVTQYGKQSDRLTASDLDLVNLQAFAAANTQSVGLYINDRTNTLIAVQQLASSVGAQVYINREGKLQLLKVGVPTSTAIVPEVVIATSDILHHTLNISNRIPAVASVKIGYCKNYTVQSNLLTAIPQAHKDSYETEWYTKTYTDYNTKSKYGLNSDPEQKDTLLLVGTEALAEAQRLQTYNNIPRTVYSFTGTSKLLSLQLGQQVNLTYPRFNMNSGVTGQVVGLTPNWMKSTIEVEVLV